MKILVPVDGSEFTQRMLATIAERTDLFTPGHEYVLFHVVAPVPPHAARFLDRNVVDDHYRDQAEAVLAPVRQFAERQGWNARTQHAHGHAAECIAAFAAAEHPSLIVMGTHGHSAFHGVLLGSVTSGVLARCKVPLMLIR